MIFPKHFNITVISNPVPCAVSGYSLLLLCSTGGSAVIKAQVLAGGRGKGTFDNGLQGGVQVANR